MRGGVERMRWSARARRGVADVGLSGAVATDMACAWTSCCTARRALGIVFAWNYFAIL